jgi:DNA primase small subunit
LDDLGFNEKDLEIVFSGGRGYHVHVMDERVRNLKSPERREIVDYILGTGLDSDRILVKETKIVEGFRGQKTMGVWQIGGFEGKRHGFGWNRRVARYIAGKLALIGGMEDKEARKELKKFELETKPVSDLLKVSRNPAELVKIREEGRLEIKGNLKGFFKNMLDGTIDEFKIDLAGKTDEPVTADIKRLIRLPGSIHGGSSFGVIPLKRKELETFNPLEDAIIFTDTPVRVLVTRPQEVEMRGKIYRVSEGVGRLPECVAMFLMCRGSAEYEP